MTPVETLTWLASSTGAIMAFSFIAERIPAWGKLSTEQKDSYSFLGASLIGVLAWSGLAYIPADVLATITPPFIIISGVFALKFISNGVHKVLNK